MNRASRLVLLIGSILAALTAGMPAPTNATDLMPLGETATRLPRGRIATSVEGGHSCMVVADGTVRCWGLNAFGQLGDGTTSTPAASVRVTGISTAIAVTTGRDHSCALLVDATVRCWGANTVGQLGNASFNASFAPVTVSGITNAVSISGGSLHTCVRRSDGTIACWGSNQFGQIGDGSIANNRPTPVPVQGIGNARMVAVGSTHTCAVRVDGTVACWGGNGVGQLGVGVSGDNRQLPNTVPGLAGVWLVATGHRFSCALLGTVELRLRCWGLNDTGQLGDGTTQDAPSPVAVLPFFSSGRGISLGNGHVCMVVQGGGLLECWGKNSAGQLGRGFTGEPLPPGGFGPQTVEVAAGLDRTCALNARDVVLCWGENSQFQLGNGSSTDVLVPTAVGGLEGGAVSARGVAAGLQHTCAWRADGTVACWGAGEVLGNGSPAPSETPVAVAGAFDSVAVTAGDFHTCALAHSGMVSCWGHNFAGQVTRIPGVPDQVILTPRPGPVSGTLSVAAGAAHTTAFAIGSSADATNLGWGSNDRLQLGFEQDFGFKEVPLTDPVAIVTGTEHSCALQARGTVVCWGSNRFGQLGDNDSSTAPVATPQAVQGIVDAVAIAAGEFHTCAVLVAGTVRCWGRNQFRQLGDGTTQNRPAPVTVPGIGIGAAVGVVAGTGYTCILGVRGNVQCWGADGQGQLGDNTFVDRPAPVFARRATAIIQFNDDNQFIAQTATLDQVVALVGGGAHVCAVRVNGQPVCWGNNGNGRLGDGTTQNRQAAVGVPSFLANIDPEADLSRNGRRAEVTALVNCPEGAHFRVRVRLRQDGAKGDGHAEGKCEGGLDRVAVHISADGRARFDEGAAEANAVIDVRRKGDLIDHQEWGRVVDLQTGP